MDFRARYRLARFAHLHEPARRLALAAPNQIDIFDVFRTPNFLRHHNHNDGKPPSKRGLSKLQAAPRTLPVELRIRNWCIHALKEKLIRDDRTGVRNPLGMNWRLIVDYQPRHGRRRAYELVRNISEANRAERALRHFEETIIDPQELSQNRRELELVRYLVDVVGVNVRCADDFERDCLYYAVEQRKYELAKLLAAKANTKPFGIHKVQYDAGMVEFQGYNPRYKLCAYNSLYFSMQRRDRRMARILIKAGLKMRHLNFKAAVQMNHLDVIRLSLELGLNVNALVGDNSGKDLTILHLVAHFDKPDLLNYLLLEWNANVNICDSNELTALSYAVTDGHQQCVEILLAHHNNLPPNRDSSLLALAIKKGFVGIVDLLVRHVAMLQSQGVFVDPDTYIQIEENANTKDYMNVCNFELERMKKSLVCDGITLYDVLVMDDLGSFLRDESAIEILKGCSLDRNFPIYGKLMRDRFEIKRKKIEFESKIIAALNKVSRMDMSGQHLIRDEIFQHLRPHHLYALSNV